MKIAGTALIVLGALIEVILGTLIIVHVIDKNPIGLFAMFSGVTFALGGLVLYFSDHWRRH